MKKSNLQKQIIKDKNLSDEPFDKKNVKFELTRHMIIVVPSTTGQKHLSKKQTEQRARQVATKMSKTFGGSTRVKGQGQYENMRYHKLDDEDVIQVEVFMTEEQWKKNKKGIERYLHNRKKSWKQEDLAVEYDTAEKMYFVK